MNKLRLLVYVLAGIGLMSMFAAAPATPSLVSTVSYTLCGIVNSVQDIIGAIAITLFLIGGVLYAVAHFLPTSLEYRKNLMGWATAMIIGGIIGLIVVLIAQPLVGLFTNIGQTIGGTAAANSIVC